MTEADMKRLGRLGGQLSIHMLVASKKLIGFEVIASVQPTHAYVKAPAELDFFLIHPLTHRISDMWYAQDRLVCLLRVT